MAELAALFETAWSSVGYAGFAALWGLKLAVTALFYRQFQKKTGHRGPIVLGWIYRQITKRRAGQGTNGH